jgi:hypothetical protein
LRYALRRQPWNPFDRAPYEFAEMNFDFHPAWMREHLSEAGFHVKHQRTVSHFRLPLFKRLFPARFLAALDGLGQPTGAWWQWTPSVFVECTVDKPGSGTPAGSLFRCPVCHGAGLHESEEAMACDGCGRLWPIEEGVYNFKSPLPI